MTFLDHCLNIVIGMCWAALLWRLLRPAGGFHHHFTLVLTGLVMMFTVKNTPLGPFLDRVSGITGIQVLVRDSTALVTTTVAVLLMTWVARGVHVPRRFQALVWLYTATCVVSLTIFFGQTPNASGIIDLTPDSARLPAVAFWMTYLIPYGLNWLAVSLIVLHILRRTEAAPVRRTALLLLGFGALIGAVYAAIKLAVVFSTDDPDSFITQHADALQTLPSVLAIALVGLGSLMGSELRLRERLLSWRLHTAYRQLSRTTNLPPVARDVLSPTEHLDRIVTLIIQENAVRAIAESRPNPDLPTNPARLASIILPWPRIIARAITEIAAPPFLVIGLLTLVGGATHAIPWALFASLFIAVLPYLVVIIGVRRGIWKDRMLTSRRERLVPLLSNTAFALIGLLGLIAGRAPSELIALTLTVITVQVTFLLITLRWKISFHAAAAAGSAALLTLDVSPLLALPCILVAAAVCWARVYLHEHTTRQVVVGAIAGTLLFPTLMALYTL